jgi:hypothetical protein
MQSRSPGQLGDLVVPESEADASASRGSPGWLMQSLPSLGASLRSSGNALRSRSRRRVHGKAVATSRRLISTPGCLLEIRTPKAGEVRPYSPLMNSSKSAFTLSGSTIAMPWEPPG